MELVSRHSFWEKYFKTSFSQISRYHGGFCGPTSKKQSQNRWYHRSYAIWDWIKYLEKALPDQFIDVGAVEEHAVFAGMATKSYHPVCAIYSTFTTCL